MARVEAPVVKKTDSKRLTPRQKRVQQATAAVTASEVSPARRGEQDEPEVELQALEESAAAAAASPAENVITPRPEHVFKASETGMEYTPPPADASDLEVLAHAQRGIVQANRAATLGLGLLERDYVLSAGQYLYDAMTPRPGSDKPPFKAAGHKSVEAFVAPLGLTRKDAYRLKDAVPVYLDIADLVEEPLAERVIRELAIAKRESGSCRDVFMEMKRTGRISAAGAVSARKLLVAGELAEIVQPDPEEKPKSTAVQTLLKARESGRLVDLEVLKEAKDQDPKSVEEYVNDVRRHAEEAASLLQA